MECQLPQPALVLFFSAGWFDRAGGRSIALISSCKSWLAIGVPILMLTTPTVSVAPHASAATGDGQSEGQAICDLNPDAGGKLSPVHSGCRFEALPDRPLLDGEVVELRARSFAGHVERAALADEQVIYFRRLQKDHLFAYASDFNPCPDNGLAGRRIRVFHTHHVEHYGYAQCGDKIVTLRVHLLKTGGTDPSAVFDKLASRVGPVFAPNN